MGYVELFSEDAIKKRVQELAREISENFSESNLVIICVLKGAFVFTSDLVRELYEYFPNLEIDFVAVSSYGDNEVSNGTPRIEKDIQIDIAGRDVLLVEDIVDTGYSFQKLLALFQTRKPKSLKTCALLSKPDRREIEVPIDFLGFGVPDAWVEGYGIDSAGLGRARKSIVSKIR